MKACLDSSSPKATNDADGSSNNSSEIFSQKKSFTSGHQAPLVPDIIQAEKFLAALGGRDFEFTFQTFDDDDTVDAKDKRKNLIRTLYGTFEEHVKELEKLNQGGAGVFVTINKTDGSGKRNATNIVRLTALFIDKDNGDLPSIWALNPSIIVATKNGQHAYWLLRDGEPLEKFRPAQKALIKNFDTDGSVHDLPRVMRLPGFYHQKDPSNPFMINIIHVDENNYSIDDVLSAFGISIENAPPKKRTNKAASSDVVKPISLTGFKKWVGTLPIEEGKDNPNGGRNETLLILIREGLGQNIPDGFLLEIVHDYCSRSNLDIGEGEAMFIRHLEEHKEKPFESFQKQYQSPFKITDKGVCYLEEKEDKEGEIGVEETWICSKLEVAAYTRDSDNKDWGRLLRFTDKDGKFHEWAMPMEMLGTDGSEYRKELLSKGLEISPAKNARNLLTIYIQSARPTQKIRCVNRIGWQGGNFVLPNHSFGSGIAGESVILQSRSDSHQSIKTLGTLDEWKEYVGLPCHGNSRLVFAISTAFAAPLLELTGEESGGFHLRGSSSTGKTTALFVAGSIWGGGGVNGYVERWRATINGLEAMAQAHCDALLLLDELAQVDAKEAGNSAYMLANGSGKARADRLGGARKKAEWRTLFLSSGEIGLAEHMSQSGQRVKAGQEARMVDIPAIAGAGMGLFETIHETPTPAEFSRRLKDAASQYYGTPILEFLSKLIADKDSAIKEINEIKKEFTSKYLNPNSDGQVCRATSRFALVAAAGELAISFGILPWEPGEAINATAVCLASWLEARGGSGDIEGKAIIGQVRAFLQENENRFGRISEDSNTEDRFIPKRAGFHRFQEKKSEWLIFPNVFTKEVCSGYDSKTVAHLLEKLGYLTCDKDGKNARVERLGNMKPMRLYCINDSIMEDKLK